MFRQVIFAIVLAMLSALVHAFGLLGLLYWQTSQWTKTERDFRPRRNLPVFLVLFGAILGLHLAEISLWAGFYSWQGILPRFETGVYFSASSYTTVGYGDIVLPANWRLLGVLESLTGVLLLGWSAAYFFSVVSRLFEIRRGLWERQFDKHASAWIRTR
jgi:voltage-gated potassium channel